jgi:hypothetical protein
VRFVGYATMPDLPALYQMAQAVLFPSLDEGFGLPLLEAFAAGTPVVASNAGAIPEVAGDAALLSAPEDAQALADNLLRVLTDRQLRERQVAAGRARAALYTWSASAAAHRDVYEAIVTPSGRGKSNATNDETSETAPTSPKLPRTTDRRKKPGGQRFSPMNAAYGDSVVPPFPIPD